MIYNTFWSGDFHLNHKNILKHSQRPFDDDIEKHDETIISNWNSVVRPKDTGIIVGDTFFGKVEKLKEYLQRLNGNLIIVLGDHDKQIWQCRHLVKEITYLKNIVIDKQFIVSFHWPIARWPRSHYGSWHCYAHCHSKFINVGKSHDVGVDNNKFFPIEFEDLKKIMANKPDNPNLIRKK